MKVAIDIRKSLEENANSYYEKAKKARKKIEGVRAILARVGRQALEKEPDKEAVPQPGRQREWFEKFRWFISSDGFLVIGGRDATTNEILIKKHTEGQDIVFHTDMAGPPFFVIKTDGKSEPPQSMQEAADATAIFSRAWKLGLQSIQVFHVKPEQVSKKARAGEYLQKGAFMIYGKTSYLTGTITAAIGTKGQMVMCGPSSAIKKNAANAVYIRQGSGKASDIARKLKARLQADIDEIIRALPSGGIELEH